MADSSDGSSMVDEILGAYFEAIERGDRADRAVLIAAHPDLAADLAAFFEQQDHLHTLAAPARPDDETGVWDSAVPATPGVRVRYVGDYEVLTEIARGGMGVVYRARQISLNRPVALKMILAGALASEEERRRFAVEAESVAGLDHPNLAPIYEVGEHEGHAYFSMKLVEGGSLADRLATFRENPSGAAHLAGTVARAISHAHRRGVLHRDLKPSNILLDPDGTPYVVDFGLARRAGDAELTGSGAILGTPAYMPPEQALGRKDAATTAADVYGLGAILYAMLAGRAPFASDSALDTLERVRTQPPVRPSTANPGVPRDLETICLKCLEKEPSRRYSSADAVAEDLDRWLRGEPIAARSVGRAERAWLWARRNPVMAVLSGLAVTLVLMLVVGSSIAAYIYSRLAGNERTAKEKATDAERHARNDAEKARRSAYFSDMNLAQIAWQRGDVAGVDELLGRHEARPGETDLRGWEWHYQWWLRHGGLRTLDPGEDFARDLPFHDPAFSADGRWLAWSSHDCILIFDTATGRLATRLPIIKNAGEQASHRVVFSPDGLTISLARAVIRPISRSRTASGDKEHTSPLSLDRWDWRAGRTLGHSRWDVNGWITDFTAAQPGRIVVSHWSFNENASGNTEGFLTLLESDPDRSTRLRRVEMYPFWKVKTDPTGRRRACFRSGGVGGGLFYFLDLASPDFRPTDYEGVGNPVDCDFSPDGRWAACIDRDLRGISLVDPDTGLRIKTFRSKLASYEFKRVWFAPPEGQILMAIGHPRRPGEHEPDEDERFLFVPDSDPGSEALFSWNIGEGGRIPNVDVLPSLGEFTAGKTPWLVSPDGHRFVSLDRAGRLEVNQFGASVPPTPPFAFNTPRNQDDAPAWGISEHRWIWWIGADGSPRVRDTITESDVHQVRAERRLGQARTAMVIEQGRRIVAVLEDEDTSTTALVWDFEEGRVVRSLTLTEKANHWSSYRLSPDGKLVVFRSSKENATTDDPKTCHLLALTDRSVVDLSAHVADFYTVYAFSPDGRRIIGCSIAGDRFLVRNMSDGRDVAVLNVSEKTFGLGDARFSPDGRLVGLIDSTGDLAVWDLETGRRRRFGHVHSRVADAFGSTDIAGVWLDFHPDGSRIVTSDGEMTKLWDVATGREIFSIAAGGSGGCFLADGRLVLGWGLALEVRPDSLEIRNHREAQGLVKSLLRLPRTRGQVFESVRGDPTISEDVRRRARLLASTVDDDADHLCRGCWEIVSGPTSTTEAYRIAADTAEFLMQRDPLNAGFLAILGIARYRLGKYREAIEALSRPAQDRKPKAVEDFALSETLSIYRAMTWHRLGRSNEARAELQRLKLGFAKKNARDPAGRDYPKPSTRALLSEAEDLIGTVDGTGDLPLDPFAKP